MLAALVLLVVAALVQQLLFDMAFLDKENLDMGSLVAFAHMSFDRGKLVDFDNKLLDKYLSALLDKENLDMGSLVALVHMPFGSDKLIDFDNKLLDKYSSVLLDKENFDMGSLVALVHMSFGTDLWVLPLPVDFVQHKSLDTYLEEILSGMGLLVVQFLDCLLVVLAGMV